MKNRTCLGKILSPIQGMAPNVSYTDWAYKN